MGDRLHARAAAVAGDEASDESEDMGFDDDEQLTAPAGPIEELKGPSPVEGLDIQLTELQDGVLVGTEVEQPVEEKMLDPTDEELLRDDLRKLKQFITPPSSPRAKPATPEEAGTPKLETEAVPGLVGSTMVALKAPPVREGKDEKSGRKGNLKKGETFLVLEAADVGGATRIRMHRGWISLASKTGAALVEVVEATAPAQTANDDAPNGSTSTQEVVERAPAAPELEPQPAPEPDIELEAQPETQPDLAADGAAAESDVTAEPVASAPSPLGQQPSLSPPGVLLRQQFDPSAFDDEDEDEKVKGEEDEEGEKDEEDEEMTMAEREAETDRPVAVTEAAEAAEAQTALTDAMASITDAMNRMPVAETDGAVVERNEPQPLVEPEAQPEVRSAGDSDPQAALTAAASQLLATMKGMPGSKEWTETRPEALRLLHMEAAASSSAEPAPEEAVVPEPEPMGVEPEPDTGASEVLESSAQSVSQLLEAAFGDTAVPEGRDAETPTNLADIRSRLQLGLMEAESPLIQAIDSGVSDPFDALQSMYNPGSPEVKPDDLLEPSHAAEEHVVEAGESDQSTESEPDGTLSLEPFHAEEETVGAAQPQLLAVICPDGVQEGDMITITTASGEELTVAVPPGVAPGDEFEIEVVPPELSLSVDGASIQEDDEGDNGDDNVGHGSESPDETQESTPPVELPRQLSREEMLEQFASARAALTATLQNKPPADRSPSPSPSPGPGPRPGLPLVLDESSPRITLQQMHLARMSLADTITSPSPTTRWSADGTPLAEEKIRQQRLGLDTPDVDVDRVIAGTPADNDGASCTEKQKPKDVSSRLHLPHRVIEEPEPEPEPSVNRRPTPLPRVARLESPQRTRKGPLPEPYVAKGVRVKKLEGEVLDRLYSSVRKQQKDRSKRASVAKKRASTPSRIRDMPEMVDRLYPQAAIDRKKASDADEAAALRRNKRTVRRLSTDANARLYETGKRMVEERHEAHKKEISNGIRHSERRQRRTGAQKPLSDASMTRLYTQVVEARKEKLMMQELLEKKLMQEKKLRKEADRLWSPPRPHRPRVRSRSNSRSSDPPLPRVANLKHPHHDRKAWVSPALHSAPSTASGMHASVPSPWPRQSSPTRNKKKKIVQVRRKSSRKVSPRPEDAETKLRNFEERRVGREQKAASRSSSRQNAIDEFAANQVALMEERAAEDAQLTPSERQALVEEADSRSEHLVQFTVECPADATPGSLIRVLGPDGSEVE